MRPLRVEDLGPEGDKPPMPAVKRSSLFGRWGIKATRERSKMPGGDAPTSTNFPALGVIPSPHPKSVPQGLLKRPAKDLWKREEKELAGDQVMDTQYGE